MENKLISLVKYRYEHRAYILKDLLIQNGIECWISNPSVFGQIDGAIVMVQSNDYNKAIELYNSLEETGYEQEK